MTERARKRAYAWMRAAAEVLLSPTADDPTQPSGAPTAQERPGAEAVALQDEATENAPPEVRARRALDQENSDGEVQPVEGLAGGAGGGVRGGAPPPAADSSRTDVTAADTQCDRVMAWVNGGFPPEATEVQLHREHLHDCPSCSENVRARIAEEKERLS